MACDLWAVLCICVLLRNNPQINSKVRVSISVECTIAKGSIYNYTASDSIKNVKHKVVSSVSWRQGFLTM